jgi:hypothetical protein
MEKNRIGQAFLEAFDELGPQGKETLLNNLRDRYHIDLRDDLAILEIDKIEAALNDLLGRPATEKIIRIVGQKLTNLASKEENTGRP